MKDLLEVTFFLQEGENPWYLNGSGIRVAIGNEFQFQYLFQDIYWNIYFDACRVKHVLKEIYVKLNIVIDFNIYVVHKWKKDWIRKEDIEIKVCFYCDITLA